MITKKQLQLEKEGLQGLKNLVEVYEEVAASRMQKVRVSVLQSRLFNEGLVNVFSRVREAYKREKLPTETRKGNGRTVAVLISANAGLYGDIIEKTFNLFSQFVSSKDVDVVVVGKLGMKLMAERMPQILFNYFDFPDESVDMDSFDMIMRYLIQFETIQVFHGQFKTILSQSPLMTSVSGEEIPEMQSVQNEDDRFIFEPTVEDIKKIFEGEIMASIFEQSLYESMLSKYASRILSLDRSYENIDKRLEELFIAERRTIHRVRNKKLLGTISGVNLW